MAFDTESLKLSLTGTSPSYSNLVYALIYGITDEQGEPVFDVGDKHKLRKNVDPDVLSRVANFVLD